MNFRRKTVPYDWSTQLKERLAHTVLVLGIAIKERVDDLSDILRCSDTVGDETVQVRRCRRKSHVERRTASF